MPNRKQSSEQVDSGVAGHAQGAFNIPSRQICPTHNTYMPYGFCKQCDRDSDPEAKAGANERGMTAQEAEYVRKKRNSGRDPDEILKEFRDRKARANQSGGE